MKTLWLRYLVTVAVLLLGWDILSAMVSSAVLPRPWAVLLAFATALGTPGFWHDFAASAFRAVCAMFVAWSVGFPLGVLMGGSRRADAFLSPLVFLTYPVPKIVFLPLAFLLLGLGDLSRVAIISLILGYQVLVTTRDGVRSIHPRHIDSVRSLGATKWQVLVEVLLPAALPHGFTALRLNSGVSVAVLFLVESFATQSGLGFLIMDGWGRMDYLSMFTGIFGMSILGVLLYESANIMERRICAWSYLRDKK